MKTMSDPTEKIGRYLREAREGRKLSQAAVAAELASRTGDKYMHTTVGKIETGKRGLSLVEAGHLADILGVNWDSLLNMIKPTTPSADTDRIGDALLSVSATIEEDILPRLHSAGNMLKEFREKYGSTRDLNEDYINRKLDSNEEHLETVRSAYGYARYVEETSGELGRDYRIAGIEDDIKDHDPEEEQQFIDGLPKEVRRRLSGGQ